MGGARLFSFVCITFCGDWSSAAGQRVLFVDALAEGDGDGTSWADAFTDLPSAVSFAKPGDQVWVAAGTYRPGASRADTFSLKDGVQFFGGLSGSEDPAGFSLSQRDLTVNESILEGDIGAAGLADNAYHVVTAVNVNRTAILDGFTIARGNASGLTLMQQDVGGGLLIVNASPTIRHCLIQGTQAGTRGGAVHVFGGSPLFAHCRLVGNRTTVTQAANNMGGAVYISGTASNPASPKFVNCLFLGNRAGVGNGGSGGVLYGGEHATAALVNCTLLHNRADTLTGGVFGSATITNCILYGNRDGNGFDLTAQLRGPVTVSHCLVQGGWPGEGNLNADPLFRDALGADGVAGTNDDDARLMAGSPCIDAGNNFAWPTDTESADLDGAARFINDPGAVDTGEPPGVALIDLGAYEKQSVCTDSVECYDGLFCNGEESCEKGNCRSGSIPACADELSCTNDVCSEADQACIHEPNHALCDNGLFCDGAETCDVLSGCFAGAPPSCDDGIACTIDHCDEPGGDCVHTADHLMCDDDLFCNGRELCQGGGCSSGAAPCEPTDSCDEILDRCDAPAADCVLDADCADANFCTDDTCLLGVCENTFHEAPCNDANACTSNDRCAGGVCTGLPIANCGAPPTDPGPGDTGPPAVDPSEEEPPITDETPEDEEPVEPPAEAPQSPCAGGAPCDEDAGEPSMPQDADGDGVADAVDLCPATPVGQSIDIWGCSDEEPTPGRGNFAIDDARRCGACGAMGSLGGMIIICVPGTILILGRPRGHKFQ